MDKSSLRIVYMGTPDFAVEPLRCLVEGGYNVVGVITMPDKPIGRHQTQLSCSPVKSYALSQGLPVLQPERLKDETFVEELRSLQADLQIVVAFRMLPEVVWQMPRLGTFNLHASLLPRYRGAAPINWAIINGDEETGITTFFLQHAIDTGHVIQQERVPIHPDDNAETIHDRLMELGGRLVVETVDNILADRVRPIPQEAMSLPVADYQRQAPKIFKDTCRIDWTQPAAATYNFIRGLSPYPGAWAEFPINDREQVLKVFRSHVVEGTSPHPIGTLFATDGHLYVQQPDALQELDVVQLSGKKRMSAADFLRGVRLAVMTLAAVCCLLSAVCCPLPAMAQRRTVAQMRSVLSSVMSAERVQRLQPVERLVEGITPATAHLSEAERTHAYTHLTVLSAPDAGFAVVSHTADAPAVLAHGAQAIDPTDVSPEFIYLMDLYEAGADRSQAPRRVSYANVPSLLRTQWAQSAPFNDHCPYYENTGKRSPTGCVATSMAQVLNYYKLPQTMRGYKTYTYANRAGHQVSHSLDFAATRFDWDNMANTYLSWRGEVVGSAAEKEAVSTLMYACGVAASMQYGESSSSAFSHNAAQGVTAMMDGVEGRLVPYSEQTIVNELQAGHPVIYGGYSSNMAGHSFVIDGVTTAGKYRCNLGWGGSGNGEYAATDMNGYAYMRDDLFIIQPTSARPESAPIAELSDLYASVRRTPVTQWKPGRWYVLWSVASARSPYAVASGSDMAVRPMMPSGEPTTACADQLVRFVPKGDGSYYLQTGTGLYLGSLTAYGKAVPRATATAEASYSIGSIAPGYFWLNNSQCHMRIDDAVGQLEGWSPAVPTDALGSSSWQLYEVALSDSPITDPDQVPTLPEFDGTKTYTLRNTGYSQGYLVALTAADAQPTLRGVTQDHANGLYAGAHYHDAVDMNNDGTYWTIETQGIRQYLRNALTGQYLTNEGDRTSYVFTAERTPIHIVQQTDGTYTLNAGTHAESYLCAATHLPQPAAYWTADDPGSQWTIEQCDMPSAYVPVETISLSCSSLTLSAGEQHTITATVQPADATRPALQWSSSDEAVVRVDANGNLTARAAGSAVVTASSVDVPSVRASLSVRVVERTQVATSPIAFDNLTPYVLCNEAGTRAYLVAEEGQSAHPSIRGAALTTHPDGYYSALYQATPDLNDPYALWQILTDHEGQHYLRSLGNGLYLTHSGEQTPYILTDDPTPINIQGRDATTFGINAGRGSRSWMSVSTNTPNPLAYWTVDNAYSAWTIYAVEGLDLTLTDPFGAGPTSVSAPRREEAREWRDLQGRSVAPPAGRGLYLRAGRPTLRR